jgi:hypothetical protein
MQLFVTGEGPLQCTSCPPHSMLDGGLCVECLGSQYYDPPTQLCKSCHKSCRSCSGPGPFSCLACVLPLHLDRLNNQCVPCCISPNQQDCCHCDKTTGSSVTTRGVTSVSLKIFSVYINPQIMVFWIVTLCRWIPVFQSNMKPPSLDLMKCSLSK